MSDDSENTPIKPNEKSPASEHVSNEKPIDKLASKVQIEDRDDDIKLREPPIMPAVQAEPPKPKDETK